MSENPSKALIFELADCVLRSWWTVVAGVCFGLAGALVALNYIPKIYEAKVKIRVTPPKIPREFVRPTVTDDLTQRLMTLREAVFETMNLARLGNKYFNDTEPWHTRKTDPQACANTIHVSLQICAALSVLMEPVLPFMAAQLRRMINLDGIRASTPGGPTEGLGWDDAGQPLLPVGHGLGPSEILVRKVEDAAIEAQIAKLEGVEARPTHEDPRSGDIRHSLADIEQARRLLGYEPEFGLQEGLRHTLEAF